LYGGYCNSHFGARCNASFRQLTSYINAATDGFQSRRWADESYTEVQFTGCTAEYGSRKVTVDMREDISNWPDTDYGSATFTNCFNGASYVSDGQWTGLEQGNYFFDLTKVGDGGGLLDVKTVYQDTTQAD
jgi:hypothetical protein